MNELTLPITRVLYGQDHPSKRRGQFKQKEQSGHFIKVHNCLSEATLRAIAEAFPTSKTAQLLRRRSG